MTGQYQPQPGIVQQPMMAQPTMGIPVFGNLQYTFTQDPLNELAMSYKATIRQQPELMEILTGCETENRYHVFITLANGMEKYLFKCKEDSTCCQRQCCPSDSREFNMRIKHISNQMDFRGNFETYYATLMKPFKCTCLCLARPSITGVFQSNNQLFGKVTEEFTCCDPLFILYNQCGIKYVITIDCSQCGFCCRKGCSKYNKVECIIREGGVNGVPVGKITKRAAQSFMEYVGDADTYDIDFPQNSTPDEKLTLIMAGLFIDYRYYETNGSDDQNNNSGYRTRKIVF